MPGETTAPAPPISRLIHGAPGRACSWASGPGTEPEAYGSTSRPPGTSGCCTRPHGLRRTGTTDTENRSFCATTRSGKPSATAKEFIYGTQPFLLQPPCQLTELDGQFDADADGQGPCLDAPCEERVIRAQSAHRAEENRF